LGVARKRYPFFLPLQRKKVNLIATQTGLTPYLDTMKAQAPLLSGKHINLEPLELRHVGGLAAAADGERSLYQWSPVPQNTAEATSYVQTALDWQEAGRAVPFATVRVEDGTVLGDRKSVV
jgi:hypothetical protein